VSYGAEAWTLTKKKEQQHTGKHFTADVRSVHLCTVTRDAPFLIIDPSTRKHCPLGHMLV